MNIDMITIRNFGIYRDPEPINLRTSKNQPIILFGGLNGGGKTTLLDAILLGLYGPLAKTSNRGSKGYHAYLRDSFNRHTHEKDAYIELSFRHHRNGKEDTFNIKRSWSCKSIVKETVKVTINGMEEPLLQENWLDFIDELIPAQVANLFFFDGEKIEQFADLENARDLLESALHSLLGLDVLNQLNVDLRTLEQRKKTALRSAEEQSKIQLKQQELDNQQMELKELKIQLAETNTDLQLVEKNLKKSTGTYKRRGGDLYDQREVLFSEKAKLKRLEQEARDQFVHEASTESPLMLIDDLLNQVVVQSEMEEKAKQAELISGMLLERDRATIETIKQVAGHDAVTTLRKQLECDRKVYEERASLTKYLHLSAEGMKQLQKAQHTLPHAEKSLNAATRQITHVDEQLERLDSKIQSIPDTESIQRYRKEVERWEKESDRLIAQRAIHEEKIQLAKNKVEMLQTSLFSQLENNTEIEFKNESDQRVIEYALKARNTLNTLKQKVIGSRLEEIENLIGSSFNKLIRKSNLIASVHISPDDYALSLKDHQEREIHPSRLSAGERQLLAIAILWGLAQAAGLPLPVVIDTPLGRLDGTHRNRLLSEYFPKASHQVLILSTDTEIAKEYYAQLAPSISRSYQIDYNPEKQASEISEGYQFA